MAEATNRADQQPPRGAAAVLDAARRRTATLGSTRVVCLDGPAGSGKTSLAARVAGLASEEGLRVEVVHMDDLYDGWSGLAAAPATIAAEVLPALADERPGGYRRYDWSAGAFGERVEVAVPDLLLLEGVGCWSPEYAAAVTLLVWVEADSEVRLSRGLDRDGEPLRQDWLDWQAAEGAWFARLGTSGRADLVIRT